MVHLEEESILITDSILQLEDKIIAIKSISMLDFSRKKEPPWTIVYVSMIFFLIALVIESSYSSNLGLDIGEILFFSSILGIIGSLIYWYINYMVSKNIVWIYLTSGQQLCIRQDHINIELETLVNAISCAMKNESEGQVP